MIFWLFHYYRNITGFQDYIQGKYMLMFLKRKEACFYDESGLNKQNLI